MKKLRNNLNLLNINKKGFPFKNVFVLGGTSEIAHEICKGLVLKGTKRIHLVSRDPRKNKEFILELTKNYKLKITNQKFDLLEEDLKIPPIAFFDLYIIAAGYLGNISTSKFDEKEALKIAKINYFALLPWISLIASEERINKPGAIWILSSVAGDRGRPSNYHYGAAKAALTTFCEGLLIRCHKKPFKVRIIKAGLINTSMSIDKGPKYLLTSKKYVAKSLIRRPYKEGIEYLPYWWFFIMKFIVILPKSIMRKL